MASCLLKADLYATSQDDGFSGMMAGNSQKCSVRVILHLAKLVNIVIWFTERELDKELLFRCGRRLI